MVPASTSPSPSASPTEAEGRDFYARLKEQLRSAPPKTVGAPSLQLREAAVLAPLFWRDGEPWILLTKRPLTLRKHPGQVSFPGGGRDPEDLTPLHTALRETQEELGLASRDVEVLGLLSAMPTITGYWVTPFVGAVPAGARLTPNPVEIDVVLEAPLWRLRREKRFAFQAQREALVWEGSEDFVWGATWHMLSQLLEHVGAVGR
jgi:8-oxo-dGTP pyrophosphatase MutT (NUDIX family)